MVHTEAKCIIGYFNIKIILIFALHRYNQNFLKKKKNMKLENKTTISI